MARKLRSASSSEATRDPHAGLLTQKSEDTAPCGNADCPHSGIVSSSGVQCDQCNNWYHMSCAKTTKKALAAMPRNSLFYCPYCVTPSVNGSTGLSQLLSDLRLDPVETTHEDLKVLHGTISYTSLHQAYLRIVTWVPNLFTLPQGKVGSQFLEEFIRILKKLTSDPKNAHSASLAFHLFPALMLQKPSARSKVKEHNNCTKARLEHWSNGNLDEIVSECLLIQDKFTSKRRKGVVNLSKTYSDLIMRGKLTQATQLLEGEESGGPLPVDDDLIAQLERKHPVAEPSHADALLKGPVKPTPASIYYNITGALIRKCALNSTGGAGPSGLSSTGAKRILCSDSFGKLTDDVCHALADLTRILATEQLPASVMQPIANCRMVGLDKSPGVRPIGIGEIFRRIITSALIQCFQDEVREIVGPLQTCAGISAGIESAFRSMQKTFNADECQAALFIDAENAFNRLNRGTALHNIEILCPQLHPFLNNFYKQPAILFVGGKSILSSEGTTQGDVAAMIMYAISMIPLVYDKTVTDIHKNFYADDGAGAGKLIRVKEWWELMKVRGPNYGYFPEPSKTVLVVKPQHLDEAEALCKSDGLIIRTSGKKYLGGVIGSTAFCSDFILQKTEKFTSMVEKLTEIAEQEPQAAYAGLVFSLQSKWSYLQRIMETPAEAWHNLSSSINNLLETIFGCKLDPTSLELAQLPARLGGLSIRDPIRQSALMNRASEYICEPHVDLICTQSENLPSGFESDQKSRRAYIRKQNTETQTELLQTIRPKLSERQDRLLEHTRRKGTSAWLTTLPIKELGYALNKMEFQDLLRLRYGISLDNLPVACVCGKPYDINHALNCTTGGFIHKRHNELRDLLANIIRETCFDVSIEPSLQPVVQTNSNRAEDGARLDIAARGFWRTGQRTLFDVRIFNPELPPISTGTFLKPSNIMNKRKSKTTRNEFRTRSTQVSPPLSIQPVVTAAT